jgi:hypothetical protein
MTAVPSPLKPKAPGNRTIGISPKAVWAAVSPAATAFVTSVISAAVSGNFNKSEFIIAAVGFGAAAASALGAFLAKPGNVVVGP